LEHAQRADKRKRQAFQPNSGRVSNVLDALASACALDNLIDPPCWLGDPGDLPHPAEMFPVANGLLHLPSRELYPAMPDYFGLTASDVKFDPDAPTPTRWFTFLEELFGDDGDAIETLQEWFGYALSADTTQQKILFVVGPRRSGKGTIGRVLT